MLNEGTLILLGLERDIWEQTPESEKSRYRSAATCFFLLSILTWLASVYLMHLLGSGWFFAVPAGLIIAFTLLGIVRFSLIIVRRSVFDYELEKARREAAAAVAAKKRSATEKIRSAIAAPLRSLIATVKNSSGSAKIPGLGGLVRWSILSMVAALIIFPLAALIHHGYIEELNSGQRERYIQAFHQDEKNRLEKAIAEHKKEQEKLRSGERTGRENTSAETQAANKARIRQLDEKITLLENQSQEAEAAFFRKLQDRYFLVFTLRAVANEAGFFIALTTIVLLILIPHFILFRLKADPKSTYAEAAVLRYRSIIDSAYEKTETEGYALLYKKYHYDPGSFRKNIFWENPPYCTVPRIHFKKKKRITKTELLKQLRNQ